MMSTLYLLDANVMIEANAAYYPPGRIPQFWLWLARMAKRGIVKVPAAILDEITPNIRDEPFTGWLSQNRQDLLFDELTNYEKLNRVYREGYRFDQNSDSLQLEILQNDAELVSYGLIDTGVRKVVTLESRQTPLDTLPSPRNRKIPLVCRLLDIPCITTFDLIRELDFRIPLSTSPAA
ncbi:MAG: DUF4411 family protein [Chloroflexi bacterium]|nr:DUF4411 family protein [Chloroflexota bacterium]